MPCRDDGPSEYDCDMMKRRLDVATRVACELSHILRGNKQLDQATRETKEWIQRHDAADAKRKLEEERERQEKKVRRSALAKLTLAEKKALGL
jgi:hypothetical protein